MKKSKKKELILNVATAISTIMLLYFVFCVLEIGYKSIRPELKISNQNAIYNWILETKNKN